MKHKLIYFYTESSARKGTGVVQYNDKYYKKTCNVWFRFGPEPTSSDD